MPRWCVFIALLLLAAPAVLAGCFDDKVETTDIDRIRGAVERDVPQARILETRVGNGLEQCCGVDLFVATDPADPAAARRLTRAVARAAGLNAPADTVTEVSNHVGGPDCTPRGPGCWVDTLSLSTAEAAWLWAQGPPPTPAQQDGVSCEGGPDLEAIGVFLGPFLGFRADPRVTARTRTAGALLPAGETADHIAQFAWGCYPAAIGTLTVTVDTAPPVTFTAEQLRQRFGARPDDLPQ